ncbi:hypothetical protein LTR12_010096 [Friedmanniomyces endolithicus]|nr:hypothetical protein LTR12_010096 [Friedmanniomyces endolithicus]
MDAACNLVIDSKVEERMGALQASLYQKIEREVQERTDAVRETLHQENSAWRDDTSEELKCLLARFSKKLKELKEHQAELHHEIEKIQTTQALSDTTPQLLPEGKAALPHEVEDLRVQVESAARKGEATAVALAKLKPYFDLLQKAVAEDYGALAVRMQNLEQTQQSTTTTYITADDGRKFLVTPLLEGDLNRLTGPQEYPPTGLAHIAQQALSSSSSLPHSSQAETFKERPSIEATGNGDLDYAVPGLTHECRRQVSASAFQPKNSESEHTRQPSTVQTATSTLRAESDAMTSQAGHLAEASAPSSPDTETIVVKLPKSTNPEPSRAHSEMVRNDSPEDTGAADGPSAVTALKQPHIRSSSLPATGQLDLLKLFQSRPDRVAKEKREVRNSALNPVEEAESTVAYGKDRRHTVMRPPRYQEQDPGPVNAAGRKGRAGAKRKYPDDEFMIPEEEDPEALELRQQKMREARDARASRRM